MNCFESTMTICTTWRVYLDFWSYMKQSDDYNMMTRLQLRIGIFLLVTVFPISFGDRMGFFMFTMLFFMCEIMIYQLKRKYYSTVQIYVRLNSWDHLGAWDQSGPPSSQTLMFMYIFHALNLFHACVLVYVFYILH